MPYRLHASPSRKPLLVLALGLVVTLAVTLMVAGFARSQDDVRFHNKLHEVRSRIQARIDAYLAVLRGGAALFQSMDDVNLRQFREFASQLNMAENYPGVQGIGFCRCIPAADLAATESAMRVQGVDGFHVWPDTRRAVYCPILYLEPLDRRNQAAIGFDMSTEPTRKRAMDIARDTGLPCATAKVQLVQEIDARKQAGFLIYLPVYKRGAPVATIEERQANLEGFVYSPFRVGDLLAGIFHNEDLLSYDVTLYDRDERSPQTLLFSSSGDQQQKPARPFKAMSAIVPVAGRMWTLDLGTKPTFFESSETLLVPLTAICGVIFTLLLFWVTKSMAVAQSAAVRLVEELRDSERRQKWEKESAEMARTEAENASRLKDEFLATISHELRTPLNAIIGWAHLLREDASDPAEVTSGLETIERNAKLQAELVNDLLDVSRILNGTLRLNVQSVQLADVIESALETVRPAANAKSIALVPHLEPDAGPVSGDPSRLQQIIWNLLSNAVKFTERGGRVDVKLERSDGCASVTVLDTGIGIAPSFLPYVFNTFRQADGSITRKHGGLGLGLAIVRHLVELQGGTVQAYSDGEGKGARFVVRFPPKSSRASEEPPGPASLDSAAQLGSSGDLKGLRILVGDDEEDARDLLRRVLAGAKAEVWLASSADEGFALLATRKPDIVVSDIGMPEEDGFSFIRRVRALSPDRGGKTPAVALTAYARLEDRRKALLSGFQVHLTKPVDPGELIAAALTVAGRVQPAASETAL